MSEDFAPAEGVADKTGTNEVSEDLGARGRLPPSYVFFF